VGVLAVAARASLLTEFEAALGLTHRGPELILPATLALLPLLSEKEGEGQMLVHICSGWVTTVVALGPRLLSWRNKELGAASPEELTAELTAEVARVLASSQDHLQLLVNKILLCARPPATRELAVELSRALGKDVQCLAPGPGAVSGLSAAETTIFDAVGTPIAGLMGNAG
jgi:hypothetical protein